MPQPTASSPISADRDILAHTVNTGVIAKHTQVTVNVMVDSLEQLAVRLAQADGALRP